jgi:hypothetical protein
LGGFLALLLGTSVWAQPNWRTQRQALGERHQTGVTRIHYSLQGPDALASTDTIAPLAQQFERAHTLYTEVLWLVPPWQNHRYPGLQAIDVHVLQLDGVMGQAGDAMVTYRYPKFTDPKSALSISVSTRWRPSNLTPEHELFHAYQYGYTFFKNAWYLEGMARAMQGAFEDKPYRTERLPQTEAELQALMSRSYTAAPFWNRLMMLCDKACSVPVSKASPAIEFKPLAGPVCGGSLIKTVLEQFHEQDLRAAKNRQLNAKDWPEAEQNAPANNPWLLAGLTEAMAQRCPIASDPELGKFYETAQRLAAP